MATTDAVGAQYKEFAQRMGYRYAPFCNQRVIGPPMTLPSNSHTRDPREIFIFGLPPDLHNYLHQLFAILSSPGPVYKVRVIVERSNNQRNRNFAYVTYYSREISVCAIQRISGVAQLIPGTYIGARRSYDNKTLYVGGIPAGKTRYEICKELWDKGIRYNTDIIVKNTTNCLNRTYFFLVFRNHNEAARVKYEYKNIRLFDRPTIIDWAIPMEEFDEEELLRTRKLFLRNLPLENSSQFNRRIGNLLRFLPLIRIYRFKDYAFIHFFRRQDAEIGILLLQAHFLLSPVEVMWGKPATYLTRQTYRMRKAHELYRKRLENRQYRKMLRRHRDQESLSSAFNELCLMMDAFILDGEE